MIVSFLILAAVTAAVAAHAWRREPKIIAAAARFTATDGLRLAIRLPFSLIAAAAIAELIPDRLVASVLGPDTGLKGIMLASLLGGLLPGGPMVSFPLAIMFAREGAGGPQIIALVTGWSVLAFHRVIAYEAPIMGWRFVALRLAASWYVPAAAALAGGLIAVILGADIRVRSAIGF